MMTDQDQVVLTISLTPEEHRQIQDLARRRGYAAPGDYLLALVEADALDDEEIDLEASFRQSWREAMTGQVHPIETLWDDLDDE